MKKLLYIIIEEIKRAAGNVSFLILILAVFVLCLLVPVSTSTEDMVNGLQLLFTKDEVILQDPAILFGQVMMQVRCGYFVMFTPLIIGLVVLPILSEDWESGRSRYVLFTAGKRNTCIGKSIAACVLGATSVVCGYMLTGVFLYAKLQQDVTYWSLAPRFCEVAIYGGVCAVWVFLLSSIVRNAYLLACIPYIFLWILERFITSWDYSTEVAGNAIREFCVEVLSSSSILNLFVYGQNVIKIFVFYISVDVLAILLHLSIMKRRVDCGQ